MMGTIPFIKLILVLYPYIQVGEGQALYSAPCEQTAVTAGSVLVCIVLFKPNES